MSQISAFAPGRVELLGNHTDYNEGLVLSAAIQLGVTAVGRRLSSGKIGLMSRQMSASAAWHGVLDEGFNRQNQWSDYPLGVVWALQQIGCRLGGFEVHFDSTLPVGAGLSSSAALEVATAMVLSRLFHFNFELMELAKLCRKAENEFVGVQCGLLDQVSSLFGKEGHVVFLDCRSERVEQIPFPQEMALLVIHSGVSHTLSGSEYNERRTACFEAARLLGVSALRDATSQQVLQIADSTFRKRALHITDENARVVQAVAALREGDVREFGSLMTASHRSSQKNFENSAPELDILVELALEQNDVYGARLTGGGFGGAIIVLVPKQKAQHVAAQIVEAYGRRTGHIAKPIVCECGEGALF
ncbi:MAG: galactokinase [Verrucomicrobia bacterium]|nr:MAG: galactokinase [Verrucomicrobiota bacterium]